MTSNKKLPNVKNPLGRICLAAILAVWAGANLWTSTFRHREIWSENISDRSIALVLSILFVMLPMVIAIWLMWTIVVGPEEKTKKRTDKKKNPKGKKPKKQS